MSGCDTFKGGAFQLWLSAGAAVIGGAACMGTAVGLNAGFFTAPGAPALCIAAGAFLTAAVVLLGKSVEELDKYAACVGLSEVCRGHFDNLRRNVQALAADIGVAAGIAYGTAAAAWVPWVPQPALIGLLAALIAFAVLVPSLVGFAVAFFNCVDEAQESPSGAAGTTGSTSGGLTQGSSSEPEALRVTVVAVEGKVRLPLDKSEIGTIEVLRRTPTGGTLRLPCTLFETKRWQIWARANVSGAIGNVTFEWTWDGHAPPAGPADQPQVRFDIDADASLLPNASPPHVVSVMVRDTQGRTASANLTVRTPQRWSECAAFGAPFLLEEMGRFFDAVRKPPLVPRLAWQIVMGQVRGRAAAMAPLLERRVGGKPAACSCCEPTASSLATPWRDAGSALHAEVKRPKE